MALERRLHLNTLLPEFVDFPNFSEDRTRIRLIPLKDALVMLLPANINCSYVPRFL